MELTIDQFHFIRPSWLALLPLALIFWYGFKRASRRSQWEDYIPKEMLSALQTKGSSKPSFWRSALLTIWLLLIIAAAGPSWDKQAVPTVENQQALAIILDLSPSMLATDLTPNRLTRARYKLIDILRKHQDGQVALIAYSGDAHTVSPLTDDPRTIEALLPALNPQVMPSLGSNIEAAITLAQKLLTDAGAANGDLLLITDGVTERAARNVKRLIDSQNRLSILAVGGREATPVPLLSGGFLRGDAGEIILAKVNTTELRSLASSTGGKFSSLRTDGSDINSLLFDDFEAAQSAETESATSYDAWIDNGHWLVLLLLPLALWFFRRGLVYMIPFFFVLPITSEAAEQSSSIWRDLWKTRDQQGADLLEREQADKAAKTFKSEDWSAIANYRDGDYDKAAAKLNGKDDVTSLYNRANALAFKGDLDEAIEAYTAVLEQQATHADAEHNKDVLEKLKEQQQQNSDDSQDENNEGSEEKGAEGSQEKNQDESEEEKDSDGSEKQKQDNSEGQNDESEQGQSEPSDQQDSDESDSEPNSDQAADDQTESEPEEQGEQESSSQPKRSEDGAETDEESDQSALQASELAETELTDSSEQWLRTITDDPSGLLRRKFEYQSKQRRQPGAQSADTHDEQRY